MLIVSSEIKIPLNEFEFSFARSSGPGGQNVNKVNSKAILRWKIAESPALPLEVFERFATRFGSRLTSTGEVVIMSDRYRDQRKNQEDCLGKLRELLLQVAKPPKPRKKTKPSRSVRAQRSESKRRQSAKKQNRRRVDRD